jgi:biotin carboxyl carrier protein
VVRVRLTLPILAVNAALLAAGVLAAEAVRAPEVRSPGAVAAPSPSPTAAPTAVSPSPRSVVPAQPSPVVAQPSPVVAQPSPVVARRAVVRTGYAPYASTGPVTLHYPGDVVEVVGLHESGHDGAQPQSPVGSLAPIGTLDSRSRDTDRQGAADIVVDPRGQVRAPVTGTVIRAGSYTLYCDHTDDYLVVEPDARPGWEVKMLHFEGLAVRTGDRVQAGVTVVGRNARVLPFESQVDKHTVAPHWPHLHVEVVDPSVKDRPSGRTCD